VPTTSAPAAPPGGGTSKEPGKADKGDKGKGDGKAKGDKGAGKG
jgi:hypothetical protein